MADVLTDRQEVLQALKQVHKWGGSVESYGCRSEWANAAGGNLSITTLKQLRDEGVVSSFDGVCERGMVSTKWSLTKYKAKRFRVGFVDGSRTATFLCSQCQKPFDLEKRTAEVEPQKMSKAPEYYSHRKQDLEKSLRFCMFNEDSFDWDKGTHLRHYIDEEGLPLLNRQLYLAEVLGTSTCSADCEATREAAHEAWVADRDAREKESKASLDMAFAYARSKKKRRKKL